MPENLSTTDLKRKPIFEKWKLALPLLNDGFYSLSVVVRH